MGLGCNAAGVVGCRIIDTERERLLGAGEVDLSLLFQGDGPAKGPPATWNDLLFQIARDQTVGNIDRVEEEPLFSILAIMWSNYKDAKRYEETAKARKGH